MAFTVNNYQRINPADLNKMGRGRSPLTDSLEIHLTKDDELILEKAEWSNDENGQSGEYPVLQFNAQQAGSDCTIALSNFRTAKKASADGKFIEVVGLCPEDATYGEIYNKIDSLRKEKDGVTFVVAKKAINYGVGRSSGYVKAIVKKQWGVNHTTSVSYWG